jgi:type IV secretion system protein VirB10
MAVSESTAAAEQRNMRPVVGRPVNNRAVWIFAAFLLIVGITLFSALSARRAALSSPSVMAPVPGTSGVIAPPPDLVIPAAPPQYYIVRNYDAASSAAAQARSAVGPHASIPSERRSRVQSAIDQPAPIYGSQRPLSPLNENQAPQAAPAFAYQSAPTRPTEADGARGGRGDSRANASRLLNPGTTVPQGTVIQAIMETALDSTRAGFARAVVSRDVSSFDGSRVLIPKGSKLFGEYKADLSQGQNRALIQWSRLTRPDGVIIDVDSPSADPLGRAGLKGKVNSHFFARFGGTILQSVLDIGVQTAARRVSRDTVILNLPNSSSAPVIQKPEDIKPTLTIRQGASVSVFVGRDLDFTSVEQ